jgi:hypothetical protein
MADSKRLEKIEQQIAALQEQKKAEQKRLRRQEKLEDQRRKFLVGAICLQHAKINVTFKEKIEALLREHVPEGDRYLWPELFGQDNAAAAEETVPQEDVNAFHDAYLTLGEGREFVRIHRLRETLGWPPERFDAVLERLRETHRIELHGGDPGKLSADEIDTSYRDTVGGATAPCYAFVLAKR